MNLKHIAIGATVISLFLIFFYFNSLQKNSSQELRQYIASYSHFQEKNDATLKLLTAEKEAHEALKIKFQSLSAKADESDREVARLKKDLDTINNPPNSARRSLVQASAIPKCWRNTPSYGPNYNYPECKNALPQNYLSWKEQPDICSYIALSPDCRYRHIFGLNFYESSQTGFGDFMMLDFMYTAHRSIKHIVELGSYKGISALYLGAMANVRGGSLVSLDISDRRSDQVRAAWDRQPHMKQIKVNLLAAAPYDQNLLPYLDWKDTLYFFDNGNKVYEVNNYLPFISKNNNPFCTHDWEDEIRMSQIQDQVTKYDYIPFAFSHAEMLGSHVRCFHKRGTVLTN